MVGKKDVWMGKSLCMQSAASKDISLRPCREGPAKGNTWPTGTRSLSQQTVLQLWLLLAQNMEHLQIPTAMHLAASLVNAAFHIH